ncbi:MAG: hypothetical protein ACE5GY_05710 [Thermodesulfobacteriota bacterium]
MTICFHCKKELDVGQRPGRGEGCPHCGSDLKVCLNCRFYDVRSYNECWEPSADRVVEKDRANFCEFFAFGDTGVDASKEEDPLQRLNDLFK